MSGWLSVQTLTGLGAALVFAALCMTNMRTAIVVFTAFGAVRGVQVGAFSGEEMTQGLFPVELLATVLIGVWCLKGGLTKTIRRTPFNLPLFLLVPCSVLSLIVGFTFFDPTIPLNHMKLSVSVGQILLLLWVIGTYLVIANSSSDLETIERIRKTIVILAMPSLLLLVSMSFWPYVEWSTSFALPASSLCFAAFFHAKNPIRKAGLLVMTIAPAIYGYRMDKAFFYAYVAVSMATIAFLCARRLALVFIPPVLVAYILAVPVATGSFEPRFLKDVVETEEQQQSLGGDGGRDALIRDSFSIWSQHPVFGVGPGNNYPYMLRYSTLGTAHNQYMNILMELGLIGLACFCWFAFGALRTGLKAWQLASRNSTRIIVAGWIGLFTAMLVGGFFGDFMIPSIRNDGLQLFALFYVQWVILGVIVSIVYLERGVRTAASGQL